MPTFRVHLRETLDHDVDIEAETEQDATVKALNLHVRAGAGSEIKVLSSRQIGPAAPNYYVESLADDPNRFYVKGPNGVVGLFERQEAAQSEADRLNEEEAEERENDY